MNQTQDKARMKRLRTEQAVQFAAQSRWEDAIAANRAILAAFPEDAEAYNRLGKSLGETGKIKEAREAYQKALEIEPTNSIARENLERAETPDFDGAGRQPRWSSSFSSSVRSSRPA